MLTDHQTRTIWAMLNILETSTPHGRYDMVTLIPGDSGHLTYGRTQTTLASGNLWKLVDAYCERDDAWFAAGLRPFLPRLKAKDVTLDEDMELRGLLEDAGSDPVMREEQDKFFDKVYWQPCCKGAAACSFQEALSHAVVYDGFIHGSWGSIRNKTNERVGPPSRENEHDWIAAYVETRRQWLANHRRADLRKTVYRMEAFGKVLEEENWVLRLPITFRDARITQEIIEGPPPPRTLRPRERPMRGPDVLEVQEALRRHGFPVAASGVYERATQEAVRDFQKKHGLQVDGRVGRNTRKALGA